MNERKKTRRDKVKKGEKGNKNVKGRERRERKKGIQTFGEECKRSGEERKEEQTKEDR